jgi:3',5'-cyclic AMP phosphodiesterase CpdA
MKNRLYFILASIILFVVPGFGQDSYNFIMLTDPQMGLYARDRNFVQETASYEFAIATVNRLKPGFVIVLGDLVNKTGDADQIREYKRISQKIDDSIPFYNVAGNHDVGSRPTPESLAEYRKNFGPDYYSFREGPVYGIVLDSSLMCDPSLVAGEYEKQKSWLEKELETAKASGAPHIIVFQHHPYFMENAEEPDAPWTIPMERRKPMLELLRQYGVRYVFCGHTHKNNSGKDEAIKVVTIAPVGMPFDKDDSGITVVSVAGPDVQYRYYGFGRLPNTLNSR